MRMYVYSMREFDELPFFEQYCSKNQVEWAYTKETPCMDNLEKAKGYDVVNIITTVINKEMIDKWHKLGVKCIATRTIGFDHIDCAYAKEKGMGVIHITYSPATVADYTIMLMLMGCRKIQYIMQRAQIQDYTLHGKIGRELPGMTVGIIGTGKIGKTVIKHLSGFGCKILAYDIYESDEVRQYAQYTDLDTIYRECDIISLHAPATDDNYHMINHEVMDKMKQGVILINCARGSLVDTQALIDGIESGKVGFAGLDVVEHESGLYYFNRMGEPGTGDVVQAVRHMRMMQSEIRRIGSMAEDELYETAKSLAVPFELVKYVHDNKKLPVVNFAAGGVATPADAALMMQLGAEGVFVGSGIFKSGNPEKRAAAIVKAVTNFTDAKLLAELSEDLGEAMVGINEQEIALLMAERGK